jgi:hypothetical protein
MYECSAQACVPPPDPALPACPVPFLQPASPFYFQPFYSPLYSPAPFPPMEPAPFPPMEPVFFPPWAPRPPPESHCHVCGPPPAPRPASPALHHHQLQPLTPVTPSYFPFPAPPPRPPATYSSASKRSTVPSRRSRQGAAGGRQPGWYRAGARWGHGGATRPDQPAGGLYQAGDR